MAETYMSKYHAAHREERLLADKQYYQDHKDESRKRTRKKRWKLKQEVLAVYGKGKCVCVSCGFSDIRVLTIDHINGGGRKHRQSLGKGHDRGGYIFYRWLKRNNYPLGYQTLCMNCQLIKQVEYPLEI